MSDSVKKMEMEKGEEYNVLVLDSELVCVCLCGSERGVEK